MRQDDDEFECTLGYTMPFCLKGGGGRKRGTEHVSEMLCVEVRWEGGSLQSALEFKGE